MSEVEPVLARAEMDGLDELVDGAVRDELVGFGVGCLDEVVGGGVCGGRVVGVWGEGSEVCRMLLVSSLLKYPGSVAAVVDTTGGFDVLGLYTVILARLQMVEDGLGGVRGAMGVGAEMGVEDVAARVLDCVKIMRVFDFVGVREAVGEIRDGLEGRSVGGVRKEEAEVEETKATTPEPPRRRTVVADSEDEEDDEDMLFDTSVPTPAPAVQDSRPDPEPQSKTDPEQTPQRNNLNNVKFILIDNLTHVLSPLLKKDSIQANTLSSTFLHALSHLTRTHNLHTILANPTTIPTPPRQTHTQQVPPPPPPAPPSIFASNVSVPSLAGVLAPYVDVGLLLSQLPRKKIDAKVYYRDGGPGVKKPRGVELVHVLEVVSDRWDGRVGAWGTYVSGEKGIS